MTTFKNLIAAALVSMTTVTSASAQLPTWAVSEPAAFEAQYPDRDILNGGALTPAGRMGLELPGGAAPAFGANTARACGNRSCYHLILRPTLFSSRSFPRKSQSHTVVGLRPRQNRSLKRETATRVFAIGTAPTFAPRQSAGNGSDPCQEKRSLALHWLCRRCCWQTSDMQSKFRQFTKDHGPYATVATTNRPRMS